MTYLWILLIVLGASAGDVLITRAMKQVGEVSTFRPKALAVLVAKILRNKNFLISLFFMAISFFSFLAVLSSNALSFIIPATSLEFVVSTLGAKFILKERITPLRWAGTAFVCAGVGLISLP